LAHQRNLTESEAKDVSTLKELREEAGLTAFNLAAQSDVSLSTINRMENGKEAVSRRIAYQVLNVLSSRIGRRITVEDVEGLRIK
jgi:DNA-binding XRE family transcriptional regulator